MGTVRVEVKWGKEVFKDVEIDLSEPPTVFKSQLFSLTGVPPERQKIMGVKGGLLKDDADWAKLGLKAGQKLSMMGTADKVPEAPQQQQTFMEDLPEEEQDTSGARGGGGRESATDSWWDMAECQRQALAGGAVGTAALARAAGDCSHRLSQPMGCSMGSGVCAVHASCCTRPTPRVSPGLLHPCPASRHEQVRRGPAEPGQHLLHEQHGAVPVRGARAAQQVGAARGWCAGWG